MKSRVGTLALCLTALAMAVTIVPGCNRQPEGERCSLKNGDLDCSEGLECTPSTNLRNGSDGIDRCCPASNFTDARCTPGRSGSGGGNEGGNGGQGGQGGGGGADSGADIGEDCIWNSDCREPLVCKSSTCQYDCNVDRDCADGYKCMANSCVLQ
ncbi:MAG TPA: hypothetical protein VLC09_13870 [Polyangiaceae bacterium]|nr:hypothetical protein [Polyangiaceae bacterium]